MGGGTLDHVLFLKPVIGMKIVSTEDLSGRGVITYIQKYNNNNTS